MYDIQLCIGVVPAWCDVVRCGVVCGMACCGMEWSGIGVVWCGVLFVYHLYIVKV